MNTYNITSLTNGKTNSIQAKDTESAVCIARQRGWIDSFYTISIQTPSFNRWNMNRGFI